MEADTVFRNAYMSSTPVFDFPAPILKNRNHPDWTFHYMPVPLHVAEALLESGTRRVILEVNGKKANRALFNNKDGEYHLVVGLSVLRELGIKPEDVVIATLRSDPNPDAVDIPPEFEEALEHDRAAAERFATFSPGKKRSVASYITQAKREETRLRRAYEIAHKLSSYTLHGDTPPDS